MPKSFFGFLYPANPRIRRLSTLRADIRGEAKFLAGQHSRVSETLRLFRIVIEYIRGFRAFQNIGPTITVFGSARFNEGHPYYDLARRVGAEIGRAGFTVMTGGGPGIMEAANRGAKDVGAPSVGCNIVVPHEQEPNKYLDRVVTFYYFFVRKLMLVKYSYAFVILPGGVGTLDEMTEAVTLIQTGKLYDFPVILVGKEYWKGLYQWFNDTLVKQGAVSASDLRFIHMTDDLGEMIAIIRENTRGLGLKNASSSSVTQ